MERRGTSGSDRDGREQRDAHHHQTDPPGRWGSGVWVAQRCRNVLGTINGFRLTDNDGMTRRGPMAPRKRRAVSPALPLGCALLLTIAAGPSGAMQGSPPPLPPRLDAYLTQVVKITPEERSQLTGGAAIAKLLDADKSKEVSVFGAIWIDAPIHRYVEAVKDIERFERGGGFKITKKIGEPARLEDFADLHLPNSDIEDLRECRVGDCDVKLGEEAIERFRSEVGWSNPTARADADAVMRQLAFEYVTGYMKGGNKRLAVLRDKSRPSFVEQEFTEMIDRMPELTTYLPEIRRYLIEFPRQSLSDATSYLYWQETEFGLKPTIRISHVLVREGRDDAVVASKLLYATHYFWTGLELRVLLPAPSPERGFWLITVSRSRSDGLSGFTGTVIRGRVQSEVEKGTLTALRSTKDALGK